MRQVSKQCGLSIKLLTENPWPDYEQLFPIESIHEGQIMSLTAKGASVKIGDKMIGFAPTKHLKTIDRIDLKINDIATFKILTLGGDEKMALVSHWYAWR